MKLHYKNFIIKIFPTDYGYDILIKNNEIRFTKDYFPTQLQAIDFAQRFIDWMENEV